ncbi:MAG: hypothetical protein LC102_07200 [Ignavibacteriales bacterium]|nr:MAG: hypothetical protein F9K26_10655 [Ignavibacteriaceae bacterium]MBW7874096.1 hypothetical protein [Ignavibacteria bacterium]MCZ2143196.1 hypothetical protein [Ignavibacteriales bacterium]OQY72613.1 MAG: hypothetical protein B6D45_08920 [Ignavibacteriales bacterium UTCHB3]MBV6444076.1 hypothetical protein [Ignavibacteriaceae bacterium]
MDSVLHGIYNNYELYKEKGFRERYYTHREMIERLTQYENNGLFSISTAGFSVEGRELKLIKTGSGSTKVFMWAQMHGDEPTANSALFDLLNFLSHPLEGEKLRDLILSNISLWLMPMVNPDGAERFKRENALKKDLNRDARELSMPESRALMGAFKSISPHFAFNLHDQGRAHAVGRTGRSATISFLAPPPDSSGSTPKNRFAAIQLISSLISVLGEVIPNNIGRYSDDYEPRAFGDSFQAMGAATILVESGGWQFDLLRTFQRRLNFLLFIAGLQSIATEEYKEWGRALYNSLPKNRKLLYDAFIPGEGENGEKKNIGLILKEEVNRRTREVGYKWKVKASGKLNGRAGYKEFNSDNMPQPGTYFDPKLPV